MHKDEPTHRCESAGWLALAGTGIVCGLIGLESVPALAIVLLEGMVALAVLASAGLAGGWVARWSGMKDAPWAERLILGAGLGIGLLSLAVLGLGSLGWLTKATAFLLAGALAVAGLARLALDLRETGVFRLGRTSTGGHKAAGAASASTPDTLLKTPESSWRWLWLLVCPFAAMMLLAACLPPGVLWREEGFGYDVLEYHLAVPKIFFEQSRIAFLPNNVYSNFPLNSEMLSLLMMALRGDAIEASFMAVMVNVGLAGLLAAAAWLAGRRFSPRAGTVAGVLAATTPWIAYLAGIAYVEVGMLALGMCALIVAERASGVSRGHAIGDALATKPGPGRTSMSLCAGLLAGLACGYKYTAVPLIALPVGFVVLAGKDSWMRRFRSLMVYGCGTLLAFSPWMIRNTLNTGNPFFPLAYSVFGDRSGTWDDESNARWQRIHGSAAVEQTDESLAARAWARTGGDFRLGAAGFILAAVGAIRRRDRWTAALLVMLVVQVVVWLTATHLFARFAAVTLLPVLALAGRALGPLSAGESRLFGPRLLGGRASRPPFRKANLDGRGAASLAPLKAGEMPAPQGRSIHAEQSRDREGADEGDKTAPSRSRLCPSGGRHDGTAGTAFTWGIIAVLVLGSIWNLYRLGGLYYDHTRVAGKPLDAYGRTGWFTGGEWPGTQHWGAINALPPGARVMLVGEARTFYLRRPCEYAIVFNRHPLAEAAERLQDPAAVLGWLRQRGVTHLLVDWGEIGRLRATYGFPPVLQDPRLYQGLTGAGLKQTAAFTYEADDPQPYATLFEVPRS